MTDGIRGTTTVAPRVLEKIATRATRDVPDVRGARVGGLRGWFQLPEPNANPNPNAQPDPDPESDHGSDAGRVSLDIELSVVYPTPVAAASDAVRRAVIDQLLRYTGVTVSQVDITIGELVAEPTARLQLGAR